MTTPSGRRADAIRRLVDVVVALVVLSVGAPAIIGVAIVVYASMGSPVLFRQERLGFRGQPFTLLKFRTMRDPAPGRENSAFDAERLTRVGRFLRTSSLDELPGFINLLRGDITLVGPRPLPTKYRARFIGDEAQRMDVHPGITGLAQIAGRNTVTWTERLALDVRYVHTRSLGGDLRILWRTIPVVLSGRGTSEGGAVVTMSELPSDRAECDATVDAGVRS